MNRILSLDFWGTVAVFNPAYARARTMYLASLLQLPEDEAHARYQYIKRGCDHSAEVFGTSQSPLVCVKNLIEGTNARTTDAVQILDDIEQLVRDNPPIINESVRSSVFILQRFHGFTIGVASNTNFIRGALVDDIHDFRWDFEVYSDEIGVSKPDMDFFRTVIKSARNSASRHHEGYIAPTQITHIGDNSVCDVRGAERAGVDAMLVKSPEETAVILESFIAQSEAAA